MPAFFETYRAAVAPAHCDHLGHMNVQHYFAAVSDGMFALMVGLGLGPEDIQRRQISFAVVRAETDFRRELRAGDVVALESALVSVEGNFAVFRHHLKNVATGDVAMSTDFRCVLLDLRTRKAMPIPDDIRAALAGLLAGSAGA
jgi:acyl-CoA thioesterase FadM